MLAPARERTTKIRDSEDTRQDMLALRKRGLTNAAISRELGYSRWYVYKLIGPQPAELSPQPKPKPEKRKRVYETKIGSTDELLALRAKGMSNIQIAELKGCTPMAVWKRIGAPSKSRGTQQHDAVQ